MPYSVSARARPTPASTTQLRLLAVEDATIHRNIVCAIGTKLGFDTTAAASLEDAVRILRERAFDCVTLDLSLGQRDGVELLHLLHSLGSEAYVIIVSGSGVAVREETLEMGRALGLNMHASFAKPVDLARLRTTLAEVQKLAEASMPVVLG